MSDMERPVRGYNRASAVVETGTGLGGRDPPHYAIAVWTWMVWPGKVPHILSVHTRRTRGQKRYSKLTARLRPGWE